MHRFTASFTLMAFLLPVPSSGAAQPAVPDTRTVAAPGSEDLVARLHAPPAVLFAAQVPEDQSWDRLLRLPAGQRIRVVQVGGAKLVGTSLSVSETELVISRYNQAIAVPRSRVSRVDLLEGSRKGRNTLVGVAIGMGAGFALGAIGDCSRASERCELLGALLVGAPVGALVGGLVGAAATRDPVLYRASPGEPTSEAARARLVRPAPSPAPPAPDLWNNVLDLDPAARVELRLQDGERLRGMPADVSPAGLTLTGPSGPMPVERERVSRLYTLTPKNRVKPFIIMTLIGAAAAAPIDLALDEAFVKPPIHPVVTILGFSAVGVLMGRGERRVLVYEAGAAPPVSGTRPATRVVLSPVAGLHRQGLLVTIVF